jgi:endonuclease V-like protein UPF0215 family
MKQQIRVLGLDDSPFRFSDKKTKKKLLIIGVVVRVPAYVEGVLRSEVTIDGLDATDRLVQMVNNSHFKKQLKLIMLDGAAFGGFNVIDIHQVYKETGIPITTITRDEPDFSAIEKALRKHFEDWKWRFKILKKGRLVSIQTEYNPLYVKYKGIFKKELEEIIKISTVRGVIPEPIRLAHVIATGVARGESHGKA